MNIYYSRSNEVDDSRVRPLIHEFISNFPDNGKAVNLTEYKRGSTYNPELVENADMVIVGVSKEAMHAPVAKGCFDEIKKALKLNKPVCVIGTFKENSSFIQLITISDLTVNNVDNWKTGYGYIYCFQKNNTYLSSSIFINDKSKIEKFLLNKYPYYNINITLTEECHEYDDYLLL